MATQLIFTVGKNALPIWVAWKHLKDLKDEGDKYVLQRPLSVCFVYTTETEHVMIRLKERCEECDSTITYSALPTEAGDPKSIREAIENNVIAELPPDCDVHVHYTGGTKVMGVETVRAHEYGLSGDLELITSYLDPRADSGAAIVDCDNNKLVEDARKKIFLKLDDIAYLNGFKLGKFYHEYPSWDGSCWQTNRIYRSPPQEPAEKELAAGCAVLDGIRDLHYIYESPLDNEPTPSNLFCYDFKEVWCYGFGYREFCHPSRNFLFNPDDTSWFRNNQVPRKLSVSTRRIKDCWETGDRTPLLEKLNIAYPKCPWETTTGTLCIDRTNADQAVDLEKMDAFFRGKWFEYAAYSAFKQALEEIGDRGKFKLYHNVFVRKIGDSDQIAPFELDVVAVLGYQVVLISCSVTSKKRDIKQKAMEAYHRAILLGGDEARAVVLCVADQQDAENIQKDLARDTGTELPLQIWGKIESEPHDLLPTTEQLKGKFEKLLREIHWV